MDKDELGAVRHANKVQTMTYMAYETKAPQIENSKKITSLEPKAKLFAV